MNKNEKVKRIKIIIDYQIKSFKNLFAYVIVLVQYFSVNFIELI